MNEDGLVRYYVVDLQRLVFLFYKDVFVELLHELDVVESALVGDVHEGLPGMDVDDGHGDRVLDWVEQQKHHPVTNFEFGQLLMIEDIEELVAF